MSGSFNSNLMVIVMDYLSDLDDADQRRAVLHTTQPKKQRRNRPLIVQAGPGAGKTRLLVSCVRQAVSTGVPPGKILMLAFGRKATRELRRRLAGLRSEGINCDAVTCATFHSLALTIIREFHDVCGFGPLFTVVADEAVDNLLDLARRTLSTKDRRQLPSKSELKRIFGYRINSGRSLASVLKRIAPDNAPNAGSIHALFNQYQRLKRQNNVVDYDDLLRLCLKLLQNPKVGDELRRRYTRIYVDEYQDTTRIQASILYQLRPSGNGVTIVGDSRQAIYSFRGANARSMREAKNLFERPAFTINLTVNYRSRRRMVTACNALMEGHGRPMKANRPKGNRPLIRYVADGIQQAKRVAADVVRSQRAGVPLREQAVLVRTLIEADLLVKELERLKMPFVTNGGSRATESTAMNAFFQMVGWVVNPRDAILGLSVLRGIPGIGLTKATTLVNAIKNVGSVHAVRHFGVPAAAKPLWKALTEIARHIQKRTIPRKRTVEEILHWLETSRAINYSKLEVELLFGTAEVSENWRDFLDRLALGNGEDEPSRDVLTISTIHSAKGREWDIVRILDVVNGMIPSCRAVSKADVEEEKRLLFVAMTRARNELELYVPKLISLPGHAIKYSSNLSLSSFVKCDALDEIYRYGLNRAAA